MRYKDLYELMKASSTAKAYFESLPLNVQIALQKQSEAINSTEDLQAFAKSVSNYQRAVALSDGRFSS